MNIIYKKEIQTNSIVFQKYCTSVSFKETCHLFYKTNKTGTLLKNSGKNERVNFKLMNGTHLSLNADYCEGANKVKHPKEDVWQIQIHESQKKGM